MCCKAQSTGQSQVTGIVSGPVDCDGGGQVGRRRRAAGPAEHSQLTDRVLSDVQTAAVALLLRQRAPEQTLGELEQLSSICGKCSC